MCYYNIVMNESLRLKETKTQPENVAQAISILEDQEYTVEQVY